MIFEKKSRRYNINAYKNLEHCKKVLGKDNGNHRKCLSILSSYEAIASFLVYLEDSTHAKKWFACNIFLFGVHFKSERGPSGKFFLY